MALIVSYLTTSHSPQVYSSDQLVKTPIKQLREKFGTEASVSNGKNYLDKIVKIQYNVPHLEPRGLAKIACGYNMFRQAFDIAPDASPETFSDNKAFRLLQAFPDISSNIRNTKRVLNNFEFSFYLYSPDNSSEHTQRMALPLLALTILYQYDNDLARAFYHWLLRNLGIPYFSAPESGVALATELCQDKPYSEETRSQIAGFLSLLDDCYLKMDELRAAFTATSMGPVS